MYTLLRFMFSEFIQIRILLYIDLILVDIRFMTKYIIIINQFFKNSRHSHLKESRHLTIEYRSL